MLIERIKISELTPAPYNPRSIDDRAMQGLKRSIERFGLVEPIVYNRTTGHVVGGHQRLKVLEAQGETETDCVIVELAESEEKALNVALNNPHISGQFTDELQIVLEDLKMEMPEEFAELRLDELETTPSDFDPMQEWKGMPEFNQEDKTAYQSVVIHFKDQDALDNFAELIEQLITPKTRFMWFPKIEIETYADKRYSGNET